MQVKVNRASMPADHPDFQPFEGAVFDWERQSWSIRISTMDELLLLTRRLNETLMFDLNGPTGLQVTVFDVYQPAPPPGLSEDSQ